MNEITYPIYHISVKWIEDSKEGCDYSDYMLNRLPTGRFWNSTGWHTMFREDKTTEEIMRETLKNWWSVYSRKLLNPSFPEISVKLSHRETWCMGWFSHWTFDLGQSDEEAIESFSRYVERMKKVNREEGIIKNGYWHDKYVLMGAEDRYRWCGDPEKRTPPPCRCEGCKKNGLLRICH